MRQKPFLGRIRRGLALIAGAMLALSILLGVAFVLVELHHNCTGEDCVICAAVAQDVAYLRAEGTALPRLIFTAIALFAIVCAIAVFQQVALRKPSLVTLKVKLSD
ncbi:MAG: hypothetical protein VB061_14780 [Christensenella sp.]|nr:hypothetical protein [Christensenella sp.]